MSRKSVIPLIFVFFVLIFSNTKVIGQTPSSDLFSLEFNAPSETSLDIIFIPEKYTLEEMDKFRATVESYYQGLLSVEPFSDFRDRINVWRIDTAEDFESMRDPTIERLITVNLNKVKQFVVDSIMDFEVDFDYSYPNDVIIVLVDDLTYGGAGYPDVAVAFTGSEGKQVMIHEVGHSFGDLGDEYVRYDEDYPAGYDIHYPNIDWDGSKWQGVPGTGAYLGAWYQNLVRPTYDSCIMRNSNHFGFCPVCRRVLVSLLENYEVEDDLAVMITQQPAENYTRTETTMTKINITYPDETFFTDADLGEILVRVYRVDKGDENVANVTIMAEDFNSTTNEWTIIWNSPYNATLGDYYFAILDMEISDTTNLNIGPIFDVTTDAFVLLESAIPEIPTYYLTVSPSVGNGEVYVNRTLHTGDTVAFTSGEIVNITAVPASGWIFSGWAFGEGGTSNPWYLTITENMTAWAIFTEVLPDEHDLTIFVTGLGSTSPVVGTHTYIEGTGVSVTAYPSSKWSFDYWLLDSVNIGSINPYIVNMITDHFLTAVFIEIPVVEYDLTVSVSGSGSTSPASGTYSYEQGSEIFVTASPFSEWIFDHWELQSVEVGSSNPYIVIMNSDKSLRAIFTEIPPQEYDLTLSVNGSGSTSPYVGNYTYEEGSKITIVASADFGWTFSHWILDSIDVGNLNPYTVNMDSNHNITAIFTEIVTQEPFELATHNVVIENNSYKVETHSNSTISDLIFNSSLGIIQFKVEGTIGTTGLCNITIPSELMSGDFLIYRDDTQLIKNVDYAETYNGTHYLFTITYQHSTHSIEILATNVIPEFTSYALMLMGIIVVTFFGFIYKKKLFPKV